MGQELKARTGEANGRLWGARAHDWAHIQEGTIRPVYEAVLQRTQVTSGTRYLDAGCGAGMAAQMAAARGAEVCGLDASVELLKIARKRTPMGRFHHGDVESLPFEDDAFDVVTGFNSFQYAGNPAVALAEAGRVTVPGGFIAAVVWGAPETMEAAALVAALRSYLPPRPPGAPGPFALSDEKTLRSLAAKAGLTPVDIIDVDSPFIYPNAETAVRGLNSSGVAVQAIEHTSEVDVTETNLRAIAPFWQAGGGYRIGATFRCLIATP